MIFIEEYICNLCSFLQCFITSCRLDPGILLSILFTNALNLCCPFTLGDHVPVPYKSANKIIFSYIYFNVTLIDRLGDGTEFSWKCPLLLVLYLLLVALTLRAIFVFIGHEGCIEHSDIITWEVLKRILVPKKRFWTKLRNENLMISTFHVINFFFFFHWLLQSLSDLGLP
jgi:hypothetical protein